MAGRPRTALIGAAAVTLLAAAVVTTGGACASSHGKSNARGAATAQSVTIAAAAAATASAGLPTQGATSAATPAATPQLAAAPAATPGERPFPYIAVVTTSDAPREGKAFSFQVVGRNLGGAGDDGSITVSTPDQAGISVDPRCPGATTLPKPTYFAKGSNIFTFNYDPAKAVYIPAPQSAAAHDPLAELDLSKAGVWQTGLECTLGVTVPQLSGPTATFYIRMAIQVPGGGYVNWPSPESDAAAPKDQQGFPVIRWVVPVGR